MFRQKIILTFLMLHILNFFLTSAVATDVLAGGWWNAPHTALNDIYSILNQSIDLNPSERLALLSTSSVPFHSMILANGWHNASTEEVYFALFHVSSQIASTLNYEPAVPSTTPTIGESLEDTSESAKNETSITNDLILSGVDAENTDYVKEENQSLPQKSTSMSYDIPPRSFAIIKRDGTNIRRDSSLKAPIIETLDKDSLVYVRGIPASQDHNNWYEIEFGIKKRIGYVLQSSLAKTDRTIDDSSTSQKYRELRIGSVGSDVLDARLRLYELGYFKKMPTQTEFTRNMANYVKQFESDFGLSVDGILSIDDQIALFTGSNSKVDNFPTPERIKTKIVKDSIVDNKATKSAIHISWADIDRAKSYVIQSALTDDFTIPNTSTVFENSFVDSTTDYSLSKTTKKYYRIKAIYPDGESDYSKTVVVSVPPYKAVKPEPQYPLELVSISVGFNSIGIPEVYIKVKNTSRKTSIDAFTLQIVCYDTYGTKLRAYGYGNSIESCIWQEGTISPGKTLSSSPRRWTLYGFENARKIEVKLESIHTTDGKIIEYPSYTKVFTWER